MCVFGCVYVYGYLRVGMYVWVCLNECGCSGMLWIWYAYVSIRMMSVNVHIYVYVYVKLPSSNLSICACPILEFCSTRVN
ncbi:hypothetical protein EON63_21775 [archaeon]|nr:MAG: hypothetical protein EON63_21775 [archaeon]